MQKLMTVKIKDDKHVNQIIIESNNDNELVSCYVGEIANSLFYQCLKTYVKYGINDLKKRDDMFLKLLFKLQIEGILTIEY